MKRNISLRITTPFIALYLVMVVFMFMNGDMYFNINNYKIVLILIDICGIFVCYACVRKHKVKDFYWLWIGLAILSLLVSKYIINKPTEQYYVLYIVLLLVFLLCISLAHYTKAQIVYMIDGYIISTLIISILLLINHKTPYAAYGIFRYALYYDSNNYYDVNFTSIYLLLPTLFSFYVFLKIKNKKRWFYFVATLINTIAIILMGSRGTFAPSLAIMAYFLLKDRGTILWKIVFVIAIVIGFLCIVPDDVYSRLLGVNYIGTESKRFLDWGYGFRAIKAEWMFGNGMRAPVDIVAEYGGHGVVRYTIHNTYLVYLAQLGVIGSIPFFAIIINPIVRLLKMKNNSFLLLCYLGFLFSIIMVESNYTYVFFVPMSVIYMILKFCSDYGISNRDTILVIFGS